MNYPLQPEQIQIKNDDLFFGSTGYTSDNYESSDWDWRQCLENLNL